MTRRELDHLLEKAVAEALGVPLPEPRGRRRTKLARANAERAARAETQPARTLEPA